MNNLVIVVEGGIVQNVIVDGHSDIRVVVRDYDGDNHDEPICVFELDPEVNSSEVVSILEDLEGT